MQSLNNQQITNRMYDMMNKIIDDSSHQKPEHHQMYKDAKKVESIVVAVHYGRSSVSRLSTADKLLAKWGF